MEEDNGEEEATKAKGQRGWSDWIHSLIENASLKKRTMRKQNCLEKIGPNLIVEDIKHMFSKDNMGSFREIKLIKRKIIYNEYVTQKPSQFLAKTR